MSVNAIRELTDVELNEVSGGLDPLSALIGGAVMLAGVLVGAYADDLGKSIPVGDIISGKGRPA